MPATQPDHGRQIAAARALLRLSMAELAKLSGLHRQSIVYNERKGRLPRRAHGAEKVARALEPLGVRFETRADGFAVVFRPSVAGERRQELVVPTPPCWDVFHAHKRKAEAVPLLTAALVGPAVACYLDCPLMPQAVDS